MNYAVQPIPPTVLTALRTRDDADNPVHPYDDPEGDATLHDSEGARPC